MLMQLLMGLGRELKTPKGIELQASIKGQIKEIVASQRDQSVNQHYFNLANFAKEQARTLGLLPVYKR